MFKSLWYSINVYAINEDFFIVQLIEKDVDSKNVV